MPVQHYFNFGSNIGILQYEILSIFNKKVYQDDGQVWRKLLGVKAKIHGELIDTDSESIFDIIDSLDIEVNMERVNWLHPIPYY